MPDARKLLSSDVIAAANPLPRSESATSSISSPLHGIDVVEDFTGKGGINHRTTCCCFSAAAPALKNAAHDAWRFVHRKIRMRCKSSRLSVAILLPTPGMEEFPACHGTATWILGR